MFLLQCSTNNIWCRNIGNNYYLCLLISFSQRSVLQLTDIKTHTLSLSIKLNITGLYFGQLLIKFIVDEDKKAFSLFYFSTCYKSGIQYKYAIYSSLLNL